MNLDNLKPAWRRFRLMHDLEPVGREEIVSMLEQAEGVTVRKIYRVPVDALLFMVITFCFQGG